MKNTIEAIKYGIRTLKVSPEEMFSLIENSNGYTGDDYGRWLANEIIKLAEKDGVGFSQLQVKKFAIISSIVEGSGLTIKDEWLERFRNLFGNEEGGTIKTSIGFPELFNTEEREDVDWYSGIDILGNWGFSESQLSSEEYENVSGEERKPWWVCAKLDTSACEKSSDLISSARSSGLQCRTRGALLLYRMCNLVDAWDLGSRDLKFAFFANASFLYDPENSGVISYFLKYFDYEGYAVDSVQLLKENSLKCDYVFVVCTPRTGIGAVKDGFVLPVAKKGEDGLELDTCKRFSRSAESVVDCLVNFDSEEEGVWGYLNISKNGFSDCSLTSVKDEDAMHSIPICRGNFADVVVYYSVAISMIDGGIGSSIKRFVNGNPMFKVLFYNCLPLFLFSTGTRFRGKNNRFDVLNSHLMKKLLDEGEMYYTFEAKRLLDVCKGFLNFLSEREGGIDEGLTFEDVRREADHDGLNSVYIEALRASEDNIRLMYRKVE